jgi:adenylate cyclase
VMRLKSDRSKGTIEIGRELCVGTLLEGSVRKVGNKVRITTQLIDVASDRHIWSENYDRNLEDVFSIQSEVAVSVASALKLRLFSKDKEKIETPPTTNIDAYTHYLKGRELRYKRSYEALKEAIRHFEIAVALDPSYAPAYVGVADCYMVCRNEGYMSLDEAFSKARDYVSRAIKLDPNLGQAHNILGSIQWWGSHDYVQSETSFKKAISLDPSNSRIHHTYGLYLSQTGRIDEAEQQIRKAMELDPLAPYTRSVLASILDYKNLNEEALEIREKIKEIDPEYYYSSCLLSSAYYYMHHTPPMKEKALGDIESFIQRFQGDELKLAEGEAVLAEWHVRFGDREKAREAIKKLERGYREEKNPDATHEIAGIYFALGDLEGFFEWMGKAIDDRQPVVGYVMYSPELNAIRADPRYTKLLEKAGVRVSTA